MAKKYDFSGWATKNDIRCADGRIIKKDAFLENDGQVVPLVWNHRHDSPANVIGHALLKNTDEGVYAYGTFNDTPNAKMAKEQVLHGDLSSLSIYANKLRQNGSEVIHGVIREVSLVLAGANPGALIDFIMHGDTESDTESIIYTGETIDVVRHSDDEDYDDDDDNYEDIEHSEEETVADVINTLTPKQKAVVFGIIGKIKKGQNEEDDDDDEEEEEDDEDKVEHSFEDEDDDEEATAEELIDIALDNDDEEGENDMKHNAFDTTEETNNEMYISHDEEEAIIRDMKRYGSLKQSAIEHGYENIACDEDVLAHSASYGVEHIDYLFPEFKTMNNPPAFISRDMSWVSKVMGGVHKTPFSRIKSMFANITADEARAKGYMKGNLKKEEVFGLLKRTTDPQTVYKKQKLDRDDIIDITDFSIVSWLKAEMRMMLNEEIARAILIGDGRTSIDEDKIKEDHIRPIWNDAELYTIESVIDDTALNSDSDKIAKEFIKRCIKARKNYKGSGNPVLFTTEDMLTDCLLLTDNNGRDLYESEEKLRIKLRVSAIVTVPVMEGAEKEGSDGGHKKYPLGIIVNLSDYNVGADKGGSIDMFEDFDIDYNQEKYLIETRCSGALIKPYSAIAINLEKATA